VLERCWFSDGGICSNFRFHFFDSLLPSRPTFALDLARGAPALSSPTPAFQKKKARPRSSTTCGSRRAPIAASRSMGALWHEDGELPVSALLGAMVDTMQNWNDNMLSKAPGYRDRMFISVTRRTRAGSISTWPTRSIRRMSDRGAARGTKSSVASTRLSKNGWDNHVWVR